MRNIAAVAVILCSFAASLPAQADWQYTKWNMTREQVLAAAQGDAHADQVTKPRDRKIGDLDCSLVGRYAAEGIQFKSNFCFDKAARLKLVTLVPPYGTCHTLEKKLRAVYGKPSRGADTEIYVWRDAKKRNRVQLGFGFSPEECSLAYEPLRRPQGGGL